MPDNIDYVWFLPSADPFSDAAQRFDSFDACRGATKRRGEETAYIQKMPVACLDVIEKATEDSDV